MTERIDQRARFDYVRYANCWEDADILCTALECAAGKRYVSIASAGDNALALLAEGAEVVAADLSLAQLACLELRCAAFRNLDYDELLAFLGAQPAGNRWPVFERIRKDLSPAARAFWNARREAVAAGILFAGKFEDYFRLFRTRMLPLIHSRKTVAALFDERDAAGRCSFYEDVWNNLRWRWCFRLFFSRFMMGRLGRDPEFFRYVKGSVGDRILARARHGMAILSPHDNPYLQFIFRGNFGPALPRYLRRCYYEPIRAGLNRLALFHGTVEEAAAAHARAGWDGYNLSDIFEYLDTPACAAIHEKLLAHARPSARFAYWNMLVPRSRPDALAGRVQALAPLSAHLFAQDKAVFYRAFVVEEVVA